MPTFISRRGHVSYLKEQDVHTDHDADKRKHVNHHGYVSFPPSEPIAALPHSFGIISLILGMTYKSARGVRPCEKHVYAPVDAAIRTNHISTIAEALIARAANVRDIGWRDPSLCRSEGISVFLSRWSCSAAGGWCASWPDVEKWAMRRDGSLTVRTQSKFELTSCLAAGSNGRTERRVARSFTSGRLTRPGGYPPSPTKGGHPRRSAFLIAP